MGFKNLIKRIKEKKHMHFLNENEGKMTLLELLNDQIMVDKFPKNYFPELQQTESGLFIKPIQHYRSTTDRYNCKYLVLDKNMIPVYEHDFDWVQLPKDGYILRVRVPISFVSDHEFNLDYLIQYDNISKSSIVETKNILRGEGNGVGNTPNVTMQTTYIFPSVTDSILSDTLRQIISNKQYFANVYLKDIISKDILDKIQ